MSTENALLSVIETIPKITFSRFRDNLENAQFWQSLSPVKDTTLELVDKGKYKYHVKDSILLEPITNLKYDMDFTGEIQYESMASTPEKGHAYHLIVKVNETNGIAKARIRAKDTPQGLKVGIFIYELEYENKSGLPITRDMVLFATRVKLREGIDIVSKRLK
jgi:hypothetical protein